MSGDIASVIETRIKLTMVDKISKTLQDSTQKMDDFNKKTEESGETIRKINQRADESGERSRRLLSRAGALTMGLGGLLKMVTQNDKELKRYTDTFTDGVTAVGGFMWAVSELRDELKDLIPDLKAAGKEIKTFFKTRSKTDLGLIGLAAGSVAAVAYAVYTGAKEKYDAYENGQPLQILDEYGNTITYTHDLTKTRRVSGDDADHWEILQKDANGKAYEYQTAADKLAEAAKKIKTPKINVPKISIPKTYDITVPIGELVRDTAAQHPEGEKWMGTVTADATKQCDSYLAMLYESVGAGFQRAIVNDADFKEKGAYHIAGQGYKPEVGDMVDFLQHVGVYMGNGMIQSRQSQGGVRTVTMAEAEKMFGSIQGYGSIREATGGKMATITLDENGKKLRDLAEETANSYTKIQRIFAELNSDIADLTGGASEFDRFIAAAAGKLAGYQEDIAAAQNRGLDVSALKSKIQEFWEACNIKAKEIKQDEILSRLGMEEKSITQMADLGSVSLDQQRKLLNEKLEAHKQFLETILQEEDMSAKRRFGIETQLTDTVKRLHEAAAYDVKQGWMLGLQEVANQQTNFKDTTTGLFDSLETGMADLIVSGGNVKNFFADFFKMILRSLTQILIKQLISSALMKALGGGGGSVSVGNISNSFASSFTGGSLFEAGGIGVSGFASGGSVQAGRSVLTNKLHGTNEAISGGYITGPGSETSDSIPALLSKGEYVVKADAVKRIGVDVLDAINRGSIAHYASGGSVQTGQTVTNNSLQTIKEIIKGGFVKGPGTETSDSVPALLSKGEYVIKAESAKKIGLPMLEALNQGKISRFAGGGSVHAGHTITNNMLHTITNNKLQTIKEIIKGGFGVGAIMESAVSMPALSTGGEKATKTEVIEKTGLPALDELDHDKKPGIINSNNAQAGRTIINNRLQSIKEIIHSGFVTGSGTETSDSVPALLSRGEYVIKAEAVKKIGLPVLDALNHGEVAHYAGGGSVQPGRLMGESGPELLRLAGKDNTSHIGREKETADNRPIVNIEIINNTGTPMKAREESTFDGIRQLKKIIIDTASSAAYTNEGGFRDAIQGAAAARG